MARVRSRTHADEKKLTLHSDAFDARAYINAHLGEKSIEELRDEQMGIEEEQEQSEQSMRLMVSRHLQTFIACKDTVEMLHSSDSNLLHAATLRKFSAAKETVQGQCKSAFFDLLERDSTLQEIKQAARVFDKFQFLLTIPDAIKKDINSGEYQKVIFNYKRARHYEKAHLLDDDKYASSLFDGVFAEVTDSVEMLRQDLLNKVQQHGIAEMAQTETYLSVLRSLEAPDLLARFIELSKDNFAAALQAECKELKATILQMKHHQEKVNQQEQAWGQLQKARSSMWMNRNRAVSHFRLRGYEQEREAAAASEESTSPLHEVLVHVSDTCALQETLSMIERCGVLLLDHLTHFWHVYERRWGEDYVQMQRLHNGAEGDSRSLDKCESMVAAMASEFFTECDDLVWPVVERLQPDSNSGATVQQWRSALLSVVRPVTKLQTSTGLRCPEMKAIKERCQHQFHQQSCGKLTAEIASWAEGVQWKAGNRVSRQFPSTALPLKFETAVLGLLELLNSADDMLAAPEQMVDALREMVLKAHEDFADLLHHLAFSDTTEASEDRLLLLWADCHVLERVVTKQTYSSLRGWLGEGDTQTYHHISSPPHLRSSMADLGWSHGNLPAALGSPREIEQQTPLDSPSNDVSEAHGSDVAVLHNVFSSLKDKLVGAAVSLRMEKVCRIITIDGFLRSDINWAYAGEPYGGVRAYCHEALLGLVELHEATVRLTKGYATRAVMTEAFNQTMAAFLHGVLSLDLFNCSDLAARNATLQLELEAELLGNAMSGFRSTVWQGFQTQAVDHLMQFYVNTNQEAERRKSARNRFFVDVHKSRVLLEALKQNPLEEGQ